MTLLLGSEEYGVFTRETSNVKGEIERKYLYEVSTKIGQIFVGFGPKSRGGIKVVILLILLQKAHPCICPRR